MNISKTIHRLGIAIAVATLGAGFVLLFLPGLTESIPVSMILADIAALGAIILSIWVVRERYSTRQNETVVPAVEYPLITPTPGDDIDDLVYRMTELREGLIEYRERIRERIGEIAVAVITDRMDCSREQAIEHLEEGTWTDQPAARAFFGAGGAGVERSLFDQILDRFSDRESPYEKQLRATVEAIESLGGFDAKESPSINSEDEETARGMRSKAIVDDDDGRHITETVRYRALLKTRHWTGVSALALLALSVGVLTSQPALLVASAVGVGIAGYTQIASGPPLANLDVTRSLSEETPQPGDEIEVTVTVENTGDTFLPDLRLVDRAPPSMQVIDGSARLGTALRPGGTATFTYTAVAERGHHDWPLQVLGRDVSGSIEREALIDADTTLDCVPRLRTTTETPVRMQTSVYSGKVETEIGGEGLEFYSVRDYQPGDPKRRIDWKTYAKSGELSTVEFRKEQAARVVLLFDGRDGSYVSPRPGTKHAVDMSVEVAFDVFASLYDQGHLVGVAAFNGIACWHGPNTGQLHLERVRNAFTDHPAMSSLPPDVAEEDVGRYVDPMVHIRRQLPMNTQIFLFSPLTDEYTYEVARQLDGAGHLVTVFSPNPTSTRTVGQRIARLERKMLIQRLRDHGIRVVDFSEDRPVDLELKYAKRRWNA
jgi:uncharacterized repeat protein (TIGR01451 family)